MDARVVDHDLDGPVGQQLPQRRPGPLAVGHVECHGPRAAAGGDDFRGQPLRFLQPAVGVHGNVQAVGGKPAADRRADAAAAAGDERALHAESSTTAARPLSTSVPPTHTLNS